MTDTPTKTIIDCVTGEVSSVPFTAEEISAREEERIAFLAREKAEEEAQAQREADKASAIAKLTALGLTEDEAIALVGA